MIHCKIPQIAMKYTVTIRIFFFKTVTIVAWIINSYIEIEKYVHNTHAPTLTIQAVPQNESYITEEKDTARVVELFLSKSAGKSILQPIYQSLKSLKKRGKYTKEIATKRFHYAVTSAVRRLSSKDNIVSLNDEQKNRAANRLLSNFEKEIRSIED